MVAFLMDIDYPHTIGSRAERLKILQCLADHKRTTPLADLLRLYDATDRVTLNDVLSRVASPTSTEVGEHFAYMKNLMVTVCNGVCEERQRLVDVAVTLIAENTLVSADDASGGGGGGGGDCEMKVQRRCLYLEVVVLPLQ